MLDFRKCTEAVSALCLCCFVLFHGFDEKFLLFSLICATHHPQNGTRKNVILLHSPLGSVSSKMPMAVSIPVGRTARSIHLLSGVSGWGYPYRRRQTVSMIVRIHYENGEREDHELLNGIHFADYIRRVDVPESEFAFSARGQQMRYLAIHPKKSAPIDRIEFLKGPDRTAPVVMAATVEE